MNSPAGVHRRIGAVSPTSADLAPSSGPRSARRVRRRSAHPALVRETEPPEMRETARSHPEHTPSRERRPLRERRAERSVASTGRAAKSSQTAARNARSNRRPPVAAPAHGGRARSCAGADRTAARRRVPAGGSKSASPERALFLRELWQPAQTSALREFLQGGDGHRIGPEHVLAVVRGVRDRIARRHRRAPAPDRRGAARRPASPRSPTGVPFGTTMPRSTSGVR